MAGDSADDPVWADYGTAFLYAAGALDKTGLMFDVGGELLMGKVRSEPVPFLTKPNPDLWALLAKLDLMGREGLDDAAASRRLLDQVTGEVQGQGLDPWQEEVPVANAQRAVRAFKVRIQPVPKPRRRPRG
jgi:hypothetical protein